MSQTGAKVGFEWKNSVDPILHCGPRGQKLGVLMSRGRVGRDAAYTPPLPGTTQSPEVRHVPCILNIAVS